MVELDILYTTSSNIQDNPSLSLTKYLMKGGKFLIFKQVTESEEYK